MATQPENEQIMEKYHIIIHSIANLLGYQYDEKAPDWIHPILHFVLLFAPVLLLTSICYLIIKNLVSYFIKRRTPTANTIGGNIRGLDENLFRFVFQTAKKQQILVLGASLLAMPILYGMLELPKQIINNALDSEKFPFKYGDYDISQLWFLLFLCGLYFLAIVVNGLHKYWLNVFKGQIAERFLRRLRLLIYREWRSDTRAKRKTDIIPILAQEVEPIGGFASDILSLPVFQGGTLLTIMTFMFVQDPILGVASIAILPIQLILLPRFQRYLNSLARERIREVRKLGGELGKQINNANRKSNEIFQVSDKLRKLENIRRKIHRMKFFIKVFNNFLTSLTPFLFYSLGGYFVIEGRITLGALVAVLAAHKDFSAPLKELFRYYQTLEDVRVRYHEIFGFFADRNELIKPVEINNQKTIGNNVLPLKNAKTIATFTVYAQPSVK